MAKKSKDVKTRPAGINDDFKVESIEMQEIFKDDRYVLVSNKSASVQNLSTQLVEGMSIKAQDGIDYDKITEFKERKAKILEKNNKDRLKRVEDKKVKDEEQEII